MTSIVDSAVKIQTTSESNFSPPSWFGEIVVISRYLRTHGVLSKINPRVAQRDRSLVQSPRASLADGPFSTARWRQWLPLLALSTAVASLRAASWTLSP